MDPIREHHMGPRRVNAAPLRPDIRQCSDRMPRVVPIPACITGGVHIRGAAPRRGRRLPRARPRGAGRPGDRKIPEHRAARPPAPLRRAARLSERRARMGVSGGSGAGAGFPAGAGGARRGAERKSRGRSENARPRVSGAADRVRGRALPRRRHGGAGGGRLRDRAAGGGLRHRPGPGLRQTAQTAGENL